MMSLARSEDVAALGNYDLALLTLDTLLQRPPKCLSDTHMRRKNLSSVHIQTESLNRLGKDDAGEASESMGETYYITQDVKRSIL